MSHAEICLSEEQEKMISEALQGKNVLVDACVGSGKTTAIQRLCDVLPKEKSILYLTYNHLLRRDAEGKIRNANATVTNYHGFAAKALKENKVGCGVPELLTAFLRVKPPIAHYDVLILDEYQDIDEESSRLLYYIQEKNPGLQIVAVGDMQQKIYDRTRLNVPDFLNRFMGERVSITFTQCFRLSKAHAEFLAGCWKKTIAGVNDACTVEHWSMEEIVEFLRAKSPEDILCLGSRRGDMTECLNRLEKSAPDRFNKNTVYASIRDEDSLNRLDTSKAAIFTTYDSSKGLERKYAVVFDFDVGYWRYRLRNTDVAQEVLRNVFLVAASRGKEKIIFAKQKDPMLGEKDFYAEPPPRIKKFEVSGMFDFKYREDVEECFSLLKTSTIRLASDSIAIQSHDGLIDLSPCIGNYQEAVFFRNYDIDRKIEIIRNWEGASDDLPASDASLDEKILYLTARETRMDRYRDQVQIPFVSMLERECIFSRLRTVFDGTEQVQFAREIRLNDYSGMGICDVILEDTVHELKFVSELAHEHYLQCAMYMLAMDLPRGRLWNVKNDEMVEITVPDKQRFLDCVAKTVSKREDASCRLFDSHEFLPLVPPTPSAPTKRAASWHYIAIIDTETNYADQVMSLGVVVAETENFTPVERKYYVFPKESQEGGMYSNALYTARDVPVETCAREEAIAQIKQLFVQMAVSCIYAYNASFDQRHLPEFSEYEWRDIMCVAARPTYNRFIPKDAELTKTGRLKRGYGAEAVMRMIEGEEYCESHNAVLDALDELKIMQKLNVRVGDYPLVSPTTVPQKSDKQNEPSRPISPLRVSPEDRGVYDVTQVAQILRRDATYVAYMTMKGYLSCINVGGQPKYFKLSVKRFLENPPEDPEDLAEFREVYERMYMTRRPIVAEKMETGKVIAPVAQVPKSPTAPTMQTVASPPPAQAVEKPVPVMRVAEIPKTPEPKKEEKTLNVAQISEKTGRRKSRIYDDIHTGKLKAEKVRGAYAVTEEEFLRYKTYLEQAGCLATLLSAMLVTLSVVLLLFLL